MYSSTSDSIQETLFKDWLSDICLCMGMCTRMQVSSASRRGHCMPCSGNYRSLWNTWCGPRNGTLNFCKGIEDSYPLSHLSLPMNGHFCLHILLFILERVNPIWVNLLPYKSKGGKAWSHGLFLHACNSKWWKTRPEVWMTVRREIWKGLERKRGNFCN